MWSYECVNSGDDYLAHHGILGMKWGVRRYQNEDGTLTSAGKKRYRNNNSKTNATKYPNCGKSIGGKIIDAHNKALENRLMDEIFPDRIHNQKKNVMRIGAAIVNSYLNSHNYTLNGKPMSVSPLAIEFITRIMDYK